MTESIYIALAKAQAEFTPVLKNKTNQHLKNRYADLQSILDAVRPALNKHGLFLTQKVVTDAGRVCIETLVIGESGDSLSSGQLFVPDVKMNSGTTAIHAMGSAITYARRYSLSAFLGVTAEDDDDGNGARDAQAKQKGKPEFVLTEEMVANARAHAAGGVEAYKAFYQAQSEDFRKALASSGWHKQCYQEAKKVDEESAEAGAEE